MKQTISILIVLVLFLKCQPNTVFPEVEKIRATHETDFSPTLESSFDTKKNIIYAATIPFAWQEIKENIPGKLNDFSNKRLQEIHNTKSHYNVLGKEEYNTSVLIEDNKIRAKAYFKLLLPFEEAFTKFEKPLKFNNSKVESFGLGAFFICKN